MTDAPSGSVTTTASPNDWIGASNVRTTAWGAVIIRDPSAGVIDSRIACALAGAATIRKVHTTNASVVATRRTIKAPTTLMRSITNAISDR